MIWALISAFSLVILLWLERVAEKDTGLKYWLKAAASAGFVGYFAANCTSFNLFSGLILLAVAFSWIGDLLLVTKGQQGWFLVGILAFVFTHAIYASAFSVFASANQQLEFIVTIVLLVVLMIVYWLWPYLIGSFRYLVLFYIAAIAIMLITAIACGLNTRQPLLIVGAVLFVLSDLLVARNRFVKQLWINRAIGLPLYYVGQYLILISAVRLASY